MPNRRLPTVERRHGALADLGVAVNVAHLGRQQSVGLAADLVGRAVVDSQRAGTAPDIDAERAPGERCLEDALAEVAGKEQAVGFTASQRGEEAELRHVDVLALVDDDEIERSLATRRGLLGDSREHFGLCNQAFGSQAYPHPFEDRPEDGPLVLAEARFATQPCHIAIGLPRVELPGVDDVVPLRFQESIAEAVRRPGLGGLAKQHSNSFVSGHVRRAEGVLVQLGGDLIDRVDDDPLRPAQVRRKSVG